MNRRQHRAPLTDSVRMETRDAELEAIAAEIFDSSASRSRPDMVCRRDYARLRRAGARACGSRCGLRRCSIGGCLCVAHHPLAAADARRGGFTQIGPRRGDRLWGVFTGRSGCCAAPRRAPHASAEPCWRAHGTEVGHRVRGIASTTGHHSCKLLVEHSMGAPFARPLHRNHAHPTPAGLLVGCGRESSRSACCASRSCPSIRVEPRCRRLAGVNARCRSTGEISFRWGR